VAVSGGREVKLNAEFSGEDLLPEGFGLPTEFFHETPDPGGPQAPRAIGDRC